MNLDVTVSAAGMRVVKLLTGKPPQTIAELMRDTGVTRTAVTEQLSELVAAGYVDRDIERLPGRGRPRHVYKTTDAAVRQLFANGQGLLVPAMWQAIEELGGREVVKRVLDHVSRSMADYYSRKITAKEPKERLRQLIGLLEEEGGLVETQEDDNQLVLHKRNCPFVSMLDKNRSVCHVDQEMMSRVVGLPVRRTTCRHDGDPCCTFAIASEE